ncbi:MAG: acyltransferase family protein [Solirubrobacteraceae bacterium]
MPRPTESGHRYVPGLDGMRALAVLCVIAYHLNVPWAKGGLLGVGVFFTLSGYLITDLLLGHSERFGNLGLGNFWLRRARRLLPALFVMLIVVSIWVALFDASQLAEVRRQVVSASLYFANWSTIAAHGSYFSRFAVPLPLDHLWSLSIEEQFYLVWPWVLALMLYLISSRRVLAVLTLAGAAASVVVMVQLYHRGYDPTRVYEGTDTRAFGLLIGASLAMVWPTRISRLSVRRSVRSPVVLDVAGLIGVIAILVLVWRTSSLSTFLYPSGLILLSVATAAAIAAVVNPSSVLGEVLGCAPLRWIGVRSYGIYLWHWPLIVLWGGAASVGVHWGRAALQVGATMVVAALSWRFVEEPIRQGALGRLRRRSRTRAAVRHARRRALALTGSIAAVLAVVVAGLGGALPAMSSGHTVAAKISGLPPKLSTPGSTSAATTRTTSAAAAHPLPPPTKSSCRSVVYIGDSTSEGETSTDYIPNPRQRLPAQLSRVGVKTLYPEISGARSIVETYDNFPNAATVAQDHISAGFHGCWILALGTNDVANATTSPVGITTRIDHMMHIIGDQPVMWITAITLLSGGQYSEAGMQAWNHDLLQTCRRHPNMRVYDWADKAKRQWFIPDGIHYYSPGYVARTHDIAQGLMHAFPEGRPASASCLVQ